MTTNMKFEDVNEFLKSVRKQGEAEGKGAACRAEFVVDLAVATAEGHITDTQADAEKVWLAFREAAAKKSGKVVTTEASHKQRVSNVLQVIKAAAIVGVNLADTLLDAHEVITECKAKGETKSNTFDAFVDIARAQIKKGNVDLTRDEVRTAIMPKEKEQKVRDEVTALEKLVKDMKIVLTGTQPTENSPGKEAFPSSELKQAIQLLDDRITLIKFSASTAGADAARARLTMALAR